MSPRSIRYLLAVAEHKSFTRAAEALYVSQPTLSQQIKHLEETLEVVLIDRSGRSVRLTDAGEVYVRYARRALQELDAGERAVHDLQDLSRGSLKLAMTPITDCMATPLLERFNARYPGISVSTMEMSQDQIEIALVADEVDVGIAFTDRLSSEARLGEIDRHPLFVEPLHLVVGDAHSLAALNEPIHVHALKETSLVLLNENFALRRHVDRYLDHHGIAPRVAINTDSIGVIVEVIRHGRLATVLPHAIARHEPGLLPLTLLPELPTHTVTLICRNGAHKSAACRAFGTLAAQWYADRFEGASEIAG